MILLRLSLPQCFSLQLTRPGSGSPTGEHATAQRQRVRSEMIQPTTPPADNDEMDVSTSPHPVEGAAKVAFFAVFYMIINTLFHRECGHSRHLWHALCRFRRRRTVGFDSTACRRRNHLEVCKSCMTKVTRVSTLSMGQSIGFF